MIIFPGWNSLTLKYLSSQIKSDMSEQHHYHIEGREVRCLFGCFSQKHSRHCLRREAIHTYVCQILIILNMEKKLKLTVHWHWTVYCLSSYSHNQNAANDAVATRHIILLQTKYCIVHSTADWLDNDTIWIYLIIFECVCWCFAVVCRVLCFCRLCGARSRSKTTDLIQTPHTIHHMCVMMSTERGHGTHTRTPCMNL